MRPLGIGRTRRAAAVCLLSVLLVVAGARPVPAQPASSLLVRNGSVIDGRGGPPAADTDVLIENGRIAAVGRNLKAPVNATVLDAAGKFIMPGLIDVHVHLDAPMVFQLSPAEKAEIVGHNAQAFLYNGVTTVLNVSSVPEWIWQQRADQRTGKVVAPRIYATGKAFTPEGGWGSRHGGALTSAEAARAQIRDYATHHADGLKVMVEGGLGNSHTYKVMADDLLQAIADEARVANLPVYVHAINLDDYRRALTIKPRAIVHGLSDPLPDGDPIIRQLVDNHIFIAPTISLFEAFTRFDDDPKLFDDPVLHRSVPAFLLANMQRPEWEKVEKERFREVARMDVYPWVKKAVPIFEANTKKMHDAGVKLAVGTDGGGPVGYNFQG